MELDESLVAYLKSVTALTALIGTRIYADRKSESTSTTNAYITYELVSENEVETLTQPDTVLLGTVYQFDVWAASRSSARNVSKQLRKAFKNLKGQIGGVTGVTISAVRKITHTTDLEEQNGVVVAYRDMQEFEIWYYETA